MSRQLLFLADTLGLGGTPKHFAELLPRLQQRGYEVSLWNQGRVDRYYNILLDQGILVQTKRRHRFALNLYRYLKRHPRTIVHSYLYAAHLADSIVAHLAGVTYVKSTRNNGLWRKDTLLESAKIRFRTWLINYHVANSHIAKEYLIAREHVPPSKITVIPNGIEDRLNAWPRISRDELGLDKNDFVLVVTHRLKKGKNVGLLIEKMKSLASELPDLRLMVIGYGPEKKRLMDRAEALGIADRCLFLGYQEYPYCLMRISDVLLSASKSEGMSNSLLEAGMMGLPAVVHKGTNAGIVVDGETGFLFDADDPVSDEFERHIMCLYENREAARRMGAAARKRYLEHYTIDQQVERYITFYESIYQ